MTGNADDGTSALSDEIYRRLLNECKNAPGDPDLSGYELCKVVHAPAPEFWRVVWYNEYDGVGRRFPVLPIKAPSTPILTEWEKLWNNLQLVEYGDSLDPKNIAGQYQRDPYGDGWGSAIFVRNGCDEPSDWMEMRVYTTTTTFHGFNRWVYFERGFCKDHVPVLGPYPPDTMEFHMGIFGIGAWSLDASDSLATGFQFWPKPDGGWKVEVEPFDIANLFTADRPVYHRR